MGNLRHFICKTCSIRVGINKPAEGYAYNMSETVQSDQTGLFQPSVLKNQAVIHSRFVVKLA